MERSKSAQAARRSRKQKRNATDLAAPDESVVRALLKSAPAARSLVTLCLLTGLLCAGAPVRITTSQYDNARSGADVSETVLSPSNVNPRQFGKLFSLPVDGDVYAQPLYLPHVEIPGKGVHDVLFVATEHDSVYAFDSRSASPTPLWHVNLLPRKAFAGTVADRDVDCPFLSPEIGITATPVIDTNSGTLYVLARSKKWRNRWSVTYVQHLHALAVTTGAEKFGGPVEIRASVPGTGAGSSQGEVEFDAQRENPRGALLLTHGSVYLTWASSCDVGPYHGWVMAYEARTLRQQASFNTSPDAAESGIWMSDTGPVADEEGHVYVVTGNGKFDAALRNGRDYGDSVLKLSLHGPRLVVSDWFTPFNQEKLNSTDGDLGSGGPLLLPGQPAGLVFGGKAGVLYVVNAQQLGRWTVNAHQQKAQTIPLSTGIYSAPAFWNGHLYTFAGNDRLKDFAVSNGKLSDAPVHQGPFPSRFSGATPVISANGTKNGVVWVIESRPWDQAGRKAVLHAFAARDVANQLYASDVNTGRDQAGEALRFTIPSVAEGRVYVGVKKAVEVYGLLAH